MGDRRQRSIEQKLKAVWELAGDAMVFFDAEGLLDCNDAALSLFGIDSREDAVGLPLHALAPPTQADGRPSRPVFAEGRQKVLDSGTERFDWQFQRRDGKALTLDVILHAVQMGGGQILHGIFRDVTEQRQAAHQLEAARRAAEASLRHLSRLGGDEFGLLLADCSADAAGIASRLVAEQARPLSVGDQRLDATVSVGVAGPGAPAQSLESLLQQAVTALHVARQYGRGGWQMFAETMNRGVRDRWRLESGLRTAVERREFVLHYQPQVDLSSNRIAGVEALLRWRHPQLGLLTPDRFIPLAEETGLIEPIGEWVLFEACRQNQAWFAGGLTPMRMSVNVAARQFQSANLSALVQRALGEACLAPEWLELELTESTLMTGSGDTIGLLSALRDQGVSLAVDDFGTGYSSLSYLKRFPLDRLKLDQSFVHDIDRDPDNLAIARAIITLGHNLRLSVIAEGVETPPQLNLLRQHRCDEAQGYHFARALPAADTEALLRRLAAA